MAVLSEEIKELISASIAYRHAVSICSENIRLKKDDDKIDSDLLGHAAQAKQRLMSASLRAEKKHFPFGDER